MQKFPLFLGLGLLFFGFGVLFNVAPLGEAIVTFLFLVGGGALALFGYNKLYK